ncbi:MAG TPA: RES family NAD+ phosphorylase [Longimicrobiaceae bacterium]|nr:RES family NAD+ phosphorylase [Longimicrobiaceae bacterium]
MDHVGVPEGDRDEVAELLLCPHCGRDSFERWDDYGEKPEEEIEADRRWATWREKFEGRVEDFAAHLRRFPYLGLNHPIGRKISSTIRDFPKTGLGAQSWCRARRPDGARVFGPMDLNPPPPRHAHAEGRFNHYGQSVFYLAESEQAALQETLNADAGEGFAWVQQFDLPVLQDILDLRTSFFAAKTLDLPILALGLIHSHLPQLVPEKDSAWKPEYFVPRFIADCARAQGFRGIIFNSQRHYEVNLVLFSWGDLKITPTGEPKLVLMKKLPSDDFAGGPNEVDLDF